MPVLQHGNSQHGLRHLPAGVSPQNPRPARAVPELAPDQMKLHAGIVN